MAFGEAEGPGVSERLARLTLHAPALIWYELASVCLRKIRHRPGDSGRLRRGLSRATDLTIHTHDIDPLDAVVVAEGTGLSAYDASYLWLARHLDVGLVTLGRQLRSAARRR